MFRPLLRIWNYERESYQSRYINKDGTFYIYEKIVMPSDKMNRIELCSGIMDRKENWIYENDLIIINECEGLYDHILPDLIYKIQFNDGVFHFRDLKNRTEEEILYKTVRTPFDYYGHFLLGNYFSKNIEVIGNINENPELLKKIRKQE